MGRKAQNNIIESNIPAELDKNFVIGLVVSTILIISLASVLLIWALARSNRLRNMIKHRCEELMEIESLPVSELQLLNQ